MTYGNLLVLQKPSHPGLQQPTAQEGMERAHVSAQGEFFHKRNPLLTQMAAVRTLVAIPTQFWVPRGRWPDSWAAGEGSP